MKETKAMKCKTNEIYPKDCLVGMKELIDDKDVDVIVTSPPYTLGILNTKYEDKRSRTRYLDWMEEVGLECKRVLKDDGSFFLNVGYTYNSPFTQEEHLFNSGMSIDGLKMFAWDSVKRLRKHFHLQNTIQCNVVINLRSDDEDIERCLNVSHEFIAHFTKNESVKLNKPAEPYQDKTHIERRKNTKSHLRDIGYHWFIPIKNFPPSDEALHSWLKGRQPPSNFPSKVPMLCIKHHGLNKTNLVLDPFIGVGNTALAAIKLGVKYLGFETDAEYNKIAKHRINQ